MKHIKLISEYRTAIMGIAIIWVFLYHIFPYEVFSKYDIFKFIASYGYTGVDIFLFVSGFGLYHGYSKYNSKNLFYKKRFQRIVPTYLLFVSILCLLYDSFNVTSLISTFFDIGFYFPNSNLLNYNWYMSALMFFYLLFPFYEKFFKKSPLKNTIITIVISLIITFILALLGCKNTAILTTRIPIFSIGIYASFLFKKENSCINTKKILYTALAALVITLIFRIIPFSPQQKELINWNWGFYCIPFIFITPGILILLSSLLEYTSKKSPQIIALLNFFGTISLEIYLIHVNSAIKEVVWHFSSNQTIFFINMLLLSIIGGYFIHKLMKHVNKFLFREKI